MEEYSDCPDELDYLFKFPYPDLFLKIAETNGSARTLTWNEKFLGRDWPKKASYVLLDNQYSWKISRNEFAFDLTRVIKVHSDLGRLIDLATYEGMTAFCMGEKIFVFSKNVPEEFTRFVVMHEYEESMAMGFYHEHAMNVSEHMREEGKSDDEISLMYNRYMDLENIAPHIDGSKCELERVLMEGEDFAKRYAEWLLASNGDIDDDSTFFNRIIPRFLARNSRADKNPLQVLIETFLVLNQLEGGSKPLSAYFREGYIKQFSWISPYIPNSIIEDPLDFVRVLA